MKALKTFCIFSVSLSMFLFSQASLAAQITGGSLDYVYNVPMIAEVGYTVCVDQPDGEDAIIISFVHNSPSTGWSDRGSASFAFTSAGCYSRSSPHWLFSHGTLYVSAKLASHGPDGGYVGLGSWSIY